MMTPLPAASPSALMTIGGVRVRDVVARGCEVGEARVARGRNPVAQQERLREGLRAFELRAARRAARST